MPVLACPKCGTNLRVPDGSAAAVRCPKCKTVFSPPAPPPAFEVVDETPAPPPPPRPAPKSAARPATRPAPQPEPDFEVIDEPAARKRGGRDDDDDDDDDDRPRSRRERGRRKRRRSWDDYEAIERAGAFRRGRVACLLLSISIWLYMGSLGVLTLFGLLAWAGAGIEGNLMVIPGLAAVGNWVVALVGLGFAVAGPRQGKGLAIGAVSVAGVHFVLLVVTFSNLQGGFRGLGAFGLGGLEWGAMVSTIPFVDLVVPGLIYGSGAGGISSEAVFAVLAGGCEIARMILILMTVQAFARAARDGGAEDKATNGIMVVAVTCGVVALVVTIVAVIVAESKMSGGLGTLGMLTFLGAYTAYTCMLIVPGIATVETKDALDRRS